MSIASEMAKLNMGSYMASNNFTRMAGEEIVTVDPIDSDPDVVDLDKRPVTKDNVDITIDIQHPQTYDTREPDPSTPPDLITTGSESFTDKYTRVYSSKKMSSSTYVSVCRTLQDVVNDSQYEYLSRGFHYGVAKANELDAFLEGTRPRVEVARFKDIKVPENAEHRYNFHRKVMIPLVQATAQALRQQTDEPLALVYRSTPYGAKIILERKYTHEQNHNPHIDHMLHKGVDITVDLMPTGMGHYRVISMQEDGSDTTTGDDAGAVPSQAVPVEAGTVSNDFALDSAQTEPNLHAFIQDRLNQKYPDLHEKVMIRYHLTYPASKRWAYLTHNPDIAGVENFVAELPVSELPFGYGDIRAYSLEHQNEFRMAVYDLHTYLNKFQYAVAGNEGFTDFLRGLGNVIGHVLNLAATGLFHGWRDFKRSELTAYCDSNVFTMRAIYSADYNQLRQMRVDLPRGMHGTYTKAFATLVEYINYLDMSSRAKQFRELLKEILSDAQKSKINMSTHTSTVNQKLVPKDIQTKFDALGKIFTSDDTDTDTFGKQFANMNEFKTVVTDCINADSYLRAVAGVYSYLEEIYDVVNKLVNNYGETMGKENAQELANVVRAIANVFDIYSVCMNDLSRIGHNLTMIILRLRNELNV